MSLIYNKDFNFNGSSQTEAAKNEMPETIMTMNASYHNDGRINFSKSIENIELYTANKEMADEDYAKFEKEVIESIGNTETVEA